MGQPTGGLTQRVGRTQLWQLIPAMSSTEQGFGEHQFKLILGVKLAILFFQSLVYQKSLMFWLQQPLRTRFKARQHYHWFEHRRTFPNHVSTRVALRYFESGTPHFLLQDGEHAFFSVAYRHRRLRYTGIFWAQPRILRIAGSPVLLLRGYNVTEPQIKPPRPRQIRIQRAAPWAMAHSDAARIQFRNWF